MSDNDETRSHNVRRAIELKSCLVGDDDEMKNLLYWRAREHTQQTRGVFVHKFISTLKVSFFSFFFFGKKFFSDTLIIAYIAAAAGIHLSRCFGRVL